MVSNYDRIVEEITKEAKALGPPADLSPDVLLALTMEIVDLEDQHRITAIRIRQLVEEKIIDTARSVSGEV